MKFDLDALTVVVTREDEDGSTTTTMERVW